MIPNIVFAHLDSDLPLYLWWQGDLTQNFDERFYSVMDLLFVDSATCRLGSQSLYHEVLPMLLGMITAS